MLTEESQCDFDPTKKAAYYDKRSEKVASEEHKDKLVEPQKIAEAIKD